MNYFAHPKTIVAFLCGHDFARTQTGVRDYIVNLKTVILAQAGIHAELANRCQVVRIERKAGALAKSLCEGSIDPRLREDDGLKLSEILDALATLRKMQRQS